MKIRIEANSLAAKRLSGVGYFTKRLTEALAQQSQVKVSAFSFNFLNRQQTPKLDQPVIQEVNRFFPLRVYAKLQSHRLALPFDFVLKPVDLTIFTNYARWPAVKSRFTATTIHDLTYLKYPELMEKNNLSHLTRVVKRSVTSSDFILTVSEAVKQELIEYFAVDSHKIVVIPVPPNESFYVENGTKIHDKYKIPTKDYIFFISTIEPRKNLPLLIDAYSKLPKEIVDRYSLVISGGMGWKSEKSSDAIKRAQEKGLHVIHTNYIDEGDKSALFQQASLFVFPSIYEGFGMPILEAAASKVPIVTTDIPVLREAAGDGAEYFVSNNSASLTQAMIKVLSQPERQKELIKKASLHLATFSWKENTEKIMAKVRELGKQIS